MTINQVSHALTASQIAALDAFHGPRVAQFGLAYRATRTLLADRPLDRDLFMTLAAGRERTMERIMADAAAEAERRGRAVACKTGCAMCCYQHVFVSASEAIRLALFIRDVGLDTSRLASFAILFSEMDHDTRYRQAHACPFLSNDACSVYAARPQACRGHASLSRYACQRDWDRRFKPMRDGQKNVPLLTAPHTLGRAVVMGSDCALLERGHQLVRLELANALTQALAPAAAEGWLRGEAVFEKAVNDDYGQTLRRYRAEALR